MRRPECGDGLGRQFLDLGESVACCRHVVVVVMVVELGTVGGVRVGVQHAQCVRDGGVAVLRTIHCAGTTLCRRGGEGVLVLLRTWMAGMELVREWAGYDVGALPPHCGKVGR